MQCSSQNKTASSATLRKTWPPNQETLYLALLGAGEITARIMCSAVDLSFQERYGEIGKDPGGVVKSVRKLKDPLHARGAERAQLQSDKEDKLISI